MSALYTASGTEGLCPEIPDAEGSTQCSYPSCDKKIARSGAESKPFRKEE